MSAEIETYRGHKVELVEGGWCFYGTKTSTVSTIASLPCGFCGEENTPEGHDGCLAHLTNDKSIMNACCGHGVENDAYIQFWKKPRIAGKEALDYTKKSNL